MSPSERKPAEILLVEDDPADLRLTMEALRISKLENNLHIARDGQEAIDFLFRRGKYENAPQPSIVLLDLNLPKKDGREVLKEVKENPDTRHIPIIVLTTSTQEEDVVRSYELQANCYITKPVDMKRFVEAIRSIDNFWFRLVTLPPRGGDE